MLNKIVDGIEVQCTPEEEADIRAAWAENDSKAVQLIGTPSLEELIAKKLAEIK